MLFAKGHTPKHKYSWDCIYDLMLRVHGGKMPVHRLGKMIGRNDEAIRRRLKELNIPKVEHVAFTEQVKQFIINNANLYMNKELSIMLNEKFPHPIFKYTTRSIASHMATWGFKRDRAARFKQQSRQTKKQWKDGIMGNVSKSLRFEVGTVVVHDYDSRGWAYKTIKTEDGWRRLHLVVWEMHNGPVPTGYAIKFKDGNHLNCEIENLELKKMEMPLQESMRNLTDNYIAGLLVGKANNKKEKDQLKTYLIESNPALIEMLRVAKKILRNDKKHSNLGNGNQTDEGPLL